MIGAPYEMETLATPVNEVEPPLCAEVLIELTVTVRVSPFALTVYDPLALSLATSKDAPEPEPL